MAKYISYNNLSFFLSKLKAIFSDISHTHTITEIETLQDTLNTIQNDVGVLEQAVADLAEETQYNIVPITQDEYDALTAVDENTLYIIEV